jgi:hypothetical protein
MAIFIDWPATENTRWSTRRNNFIGVFTECRSLTTGDVGTNSCHVLFDEFVFIFS